MSPPVVAVVGDRFMRPDFIVQAFASVSEVDVHTRGFELDWPDTDMVLHGENENAGLGEFLGDQAAIGEFIGDCPILVTHLAPVGRTLLAAAPQLEMIGVARGGPVNVDVQAVAERGIKLVNAPGRNAAAVAEFTVGAILSATRRLTIGHAALASGAWRGDLYRADRTGCELSELTVGLVGYGEIGRRLPPLLAPFGCRLLVHDPYVCVAPGAPVEPVDMATLLAESDVVSLHARVTAETRRLFAAEAFRRMKQGAYFINTARGPLVDYDHLYAALVSGKLAGCALDTFDPEPPASDSPLLKLPNVTLTPHIAGASVRTIHRAAAMMAEEVRRHIVGAPAVNPVC